ncbi:uncharacterized protein RAG0_04734 [Rhynchosporium agropyri]|uniref:Uncharacterized protein n=1 Tax=Rhynchosporium agropyri TaxID=914238 RepID=A0A1E1KA11_9HELO|nr:uncharacterized protein RAG0_04734 [Rhynchosporium agropyri]
MWQRFYVVLLLAGPPPVSLAHSLTVGLSKCHVHANATLSALYR